MKRVLLLGVGTPGYIRSLRHHGPGLRTEHFAWALRKAGLELLVLNVFPGEEVPPVQPQVRTQGLAPPTLYVRERDLLGETVVKAIHSFSPDCVVGASVYASNLALRLDLGLPLWADIFGDFMAEAQAKAVATSDEWALVHFWSLLRPVLEQADRYSAVSEAQASALKGQLGLAGRLGRATAGEALVSVLPCATRPARQQPRVGFLRPSRLPEAAFVALWSGGFNTWCDVDLLFNGLERAMQELPALHFVATGGSIPGHDERTHAQALKRAKSSRFSDRMHFLGWLEDEDATAVVDDADIGVVIERDLYERELGSENRVVQWAARGVPSVTTARSPLGASMVAAGAAAAVSSSNAQGLAEALLRVGKDPALLAELSTAARTWAKEHADPDRSALRLVEWCQAPKRAGDHKGVRLIQVGLLSKPETAVEFLEAYLSRLSLGQLAFRTSRWVFRRMGSKAVAAWRRLSGAGARRVGVRDGSKIS